MDERRGGGVSRPISEPRWPSEPLSPPPRWVGMPRSVFPTSQAEQFAAGLRYIRESYGAPGLSDNSGIVREDDDQGADG
jgi:hypothetical protein